MTTDNLKKAFDLTIAVYERNALKLLELKKYPEAHTESVRAKTLRELMADDSLIEMLAGRIHELQLEAVLAK